MSRSTQVTPLRAAGDDVAAGLRTARYRSVETGAATRTAGA